MKISFTLAALLLTAPLAATALTDPPKATVDTLQRGQPVTIAGIVDRITDEDEFLLRDDTGKVEVYVGANLVPALEGENVTVIGTVDDDGLLEIYARAIIRADGTRVELAQGY